VAILQLSQDKQICYEMIEGEGDKPYLVFLHEGLGCIKMWGAFPFLLCKETGCPGIIYDRLGYGQSSPLMIPWTIHYMHEYALIELPEVLAQLIPHRDYFLIGHSDGGSIALIFAAGKPVCLRGVITEAAHVFVENETLNAVRSATKAFLTGKMDNLYKYHGLKTKIIFSAWSETWLSEWFKHWNIEYLLPSISCPVLVLQGAEDQYATSAQVESISSKTLNAQKEIIADCAHRPHQEEAQTILQLMKNYLERQGLK